MANGLMGWLQERTPGAGDWIKGLRGKAQPATEAVTSAPGVDPAAGDVAMAGMLGTTSNVLRTQARNAGAALGRGWDALRGVTPNSAGIKTGETIKAAEDLAGKAKAAVGEFGAGVQQGRGISGVATPGMATAEQMAASGAPGYGPQIPRGIKMARATVGGISRAAGYALPVAFGAGVLSEGADQMNRSGIAGALGAQEEVDKNKVQYPAALDYTTPGIIANVAKTAFGSEPIDVNRRERLKGLVGAGLQAINPMNLVPDDPFGAKSSVDRRGQNFGVAPRATNGLRSDAVPASGSVPAAQPAPMTPAQAQNTPGYGTVTNDQTGGTQVIGGSRVAGTSFIGRKGLDPNAAAALEVARIQTEIDKNRQIGDANDQLRGGFRGASSSQPLGEPKGRFGGAFQALSTLQGAGAASQLKKTEADVGLRKQANTLAATKAAYDIMFKDRELNQKDEDLKLKRQTLDNTQEEAGAKRHEANIQSLGDELTGSRKPGYITNESDADYKIRRDQTIANLRNDIQYSVGDRGDGKKIGNMTNTEFQQLALAKRIKDKVVDARGGFLQGMRDFFGNKEFDSKNLYSYMPVKAEKATLPGGGGYVIHFKNGNTASVVDVGGGNFRMASSNKPVDADVMQLIYPLIQQAGQTTKGK